VSEFVVYLWVVSLIDHPLARFLRSGALPTTHPRAGGEPGTLRYMEQPGT
jgi:hypothetical protein